MVTLEQTYRYAAPSRASPGRLHLATELPWFFQGNLTAPRRTADLLLALSRVVRSRFHTPAAMLARILREADPVITCGVDRLRLEGFSACCGAYARVDLLPAAMDGALLSHGTTNVDFNPEMRAALTSLGEGERCALTVGREGIELAGVSEKRVPLPLRWLKGFVEAQAHQARMQLFFDIDASETRRFLRELRGESSGYVVSAGRGLRLSQVKAPGAVSVAGVQRLKVLQDLARHARGLRVYGHDQGASAFELILPEARFHLVLSPEVWRGFSGEGQVLGQLLSPADSERLRQALSWQPVLSVEELSARSGLTGPEVLSALAHLGSRGVVGYDLELGGWFHRTLPYDYSLVEEMHPRLKAARKLVESGGVRREGEQAWVRGTQVEHRVRSGRCTCPWFAAHQGERGPCKHVLAVQLLEEGEDEPTGA